MTIKCINIIYTYKYILFFLFTIIQLKDFYNNKIIKTYIRSNIHVWLDIHFGRLNNQASGFQLPAIIYILVMYNFKLVIIPLSVGSIYYSTLY